MRVEDMLHPLQVGIGEPLPLGILVTVHSTLTSGFLNIVGRENSPAITYFT